MDIDKLIDTALAGYADATPRAGLEQRVLSRVRNAEARRRGVVAGVAIGLAAAVLFMMVGIRTPPNAVPEIAPKTAEVAGAPIVYAKAPPVPVRKRRLHRAIAPAPLSGEERALVALVERHPEETLLAFADMQRRSSAPVEIPEIEIKPLPSYDNQ